MPRDECCFLILSWKPALDRLSARADGAALDANRETAEAVIGRIYAIFDRQDEISRLAGVDMDVLPRRVRRGLRVMRDLARSKRPK